MDKFILDLRSVKCPMNLVLVKKAVHDGSFANGGEIFVEDEVARENILNYLRFKKFDVLEKEESVFVKNCSTKTPLQLHQLL